MKRLFILGSAAMLWAGCGAPVEPRDEGVADAGDPVDETDAGAAEDVDAGTVVAAPAGVLGANGALYFDLKLASGADLPDRGTNVLLVTISEPTGVVSGATLVTKVLMPSMPGMSTKKASVAELGDGVYKLAPFFVSMGGDWRIKITATAPDGTMDTFTRDWDVP